MHSKIGLFHLLICLGEEWLGPEMLEFGPEDAPELGGMSMSDHNKFFFLDSSMVAREGFVKALLRRVTVRCFGYVVNQCVEYINQC